MDVDITDILADITRTSQSHSTATPSTQSYDPHTATTDHHALIRTWTNERTIPILLPYPHALITRVLDRLRAQITRIEDLTSGVPPQAQPFGTSAVLSQQNVNLTLGILQTDLSRTQFLLRSYLRQRLQKLTKHAAHYLDLVTTSESKSEVAELLSPAELEFLHSHQALLSRFYDQAFLQILPGGLRRLDDVSGGAGVRMVEGPDMGSGVVVRCLAEGWGNYEAIRSGGGEGDEEGRPTVELRMRRGEVWVVRWRDVAGGVRGGDLELL